MKDDFACLILFLILGKGSSGRIKHIFGCRSHFDSVEGGEGENQRRLWLSFLF
jgi:hypothetical protein